MTKLTEFIQLQENPNAGTPAGLKALEESVEQNGVFDGMTVAADGTVLSGNKRQEVLVGKGLDEAIVVETDGTKPVVIKRTDVPSAEDPKGQRIILAANQVHQVSYAPDEKVILAMLAREKERSGSVKGTGYTERDLRELAAKHGADQPAPEVPEDAGLELLAKWGVAPGDVWIIPSKATPGGEHRLVCGDCTDAATVARVMRGEKAKLVVTSPPYAVGKEYEIGVSFEKHMELLRGFSGVAVSITEPGGFIFTNFGEIAALSHTRSLTDSDRQCIYPISKDYWQIYHVELKCDLYAQRIWYKPFNRLQQPFWSYKTSIPHYQEWEHIWTWRTPGGDSDECFDWDISVHAIWDTRNESTDDKPLTRHVAAFPVCLPERAIKAHSASGSIVYEPFCGSGTTLLACERTARLGRGCEISPKYCAVILERLSLAGLEPHRSETDA